MCNEIASSNGIVIILASEFILLVLLAGSRHFHVSGLAVLLTSVGINYL